jgi:putative ABC transport system permease protein
LPFLEDIMHKGLRLTFNFSVVLYLLITGAFVTLLAGFYPALELSGFNPITIFKNKVNPKTGGGILLRRGLVVFQFVIAQLLIIGTVVVVKQMQFFRSRPMGFDKENVVLVNLPSDSSMRVKYPMLQSRMQQLNGVTATSFCWEAPVSSFSYHEPFHFNNESEQKDFNMVRQFGDSGFYRTFGLQLATGRYPFHADTTEEIVINETAVRKLGMQHPEEAIGKTISFGGIRKVPIVGVLKDYNHRSLHEAIAPVAVSPEKGTYEWLAIRVGQSKMRATLGEVRKLFTSIYPSYMYDQLFLDERIGWYYESEAITARLFKLFAILAIFICCLGLYGLVSFMAVQKTKEVGIRKVLGASVQSIVYLFSKEFTILIGIAFLIAAPTGYFLMKRWLADFYYHTSIGWGVFVLAILFSVIIAWITVGYKAVKAASVNPVKSLKTE